MPHMRYQKLVAAHHEDERLWSQYEDACKSFVQRFCRDLIVYLSCQDGEVDVPKMEFEEKGDIIQSAWGDRMHLDRNAFWLFAIRIYFDGRRSWLNLLCKVKRTASDSVVHSGEIVVSVEIEENGEYRLDELVEATYKQAESALDSRFADFIGGKPAKPSIGFPRPSL